MPKHHGNSYLRLERLLQWLFLLALLTFCLSHPVKGQDDNFDHLAIARKSLDNHIVPGYRNVHRSAELLVTSFEILCREPSKNSIESVYRKFSELVAAWGLMEHIRFGPVVENNRLERLAFWPDPKGVGRRQIYRSIRTRSPDLHDVSKLRDKSVALQGLTALEVVMFNAKGDREFKDTGLDQFNCIFGKTISANILYMVSEIIESWTSESGYRKYWLNPGADNPVYLRPEEVTRELSVAYFEALNRIREFKLAAPMGFRPNQLRATQPPFSRSNNSTRLIAANIQGVLNLLNETGILDKMNSLYKQQFRIVSAKLSGAIQILNGITEAGSTHSDFTAPRIKSRLIGVGAPLKFAREAGSLILLGDTGLATRFNDSDGN